MRSLVRSVERLQRLATFEAAGRLGTFTAAAGELGMTQPAATRQIRELERTLNLELFERTANRSSLTAAGRRLWNTLDSSFALVEQTIADLSGHGDVFVLASPAGFAQQLIVPFLDSIHEVVPDRDVRLWLYDRDDDLASGGFDLAVRVGDTAWPGCEQRRLFAETVVPVATPALALERGLDANASPEAVLRAPLIHMDADGRNWMSWADWLAPFGLELSNRPRRVIHNTYPLVLQQALAGQGVALGWRGIIDQYLVDGLLVEVGPEVTSRAQYAVTWPSNRGLESVDSVVAWLLENVAAPTSDGARGAAERATPHRYDQLR